MNFDHLSARTAEVNPEVTDNQNERVDVQDDYNPDVLVNDGNQHVDVDDRYDPDAIIDSELPDVVQDDVIDSYDPDAIVWDVNVDPGESYENSEDDAVENSDNSIEVPELHGEESSSDISLIDNADDSIVIDSDLYMDGTADSISDYSYNESDTAIDETVYEKNKEIANQNKPDVLSNVELYNSPEKRRQKALESKGEWKGEPGKSEFIPESKEAKDCLEKYDVDSISYDDNYEPNFSPVSVATVEIDNMNSERLGPDGNYEQAFDKLAKKFNEEAKDGKTDWTARDVDNWRTENKFTPHERMNRKTVDFVPSAIHKECKHCGGVSECKTKEKMGGGFDE